MTKMVNNFQYHYHVEVTSNNSVNLVTINADKELTELEILSKIQEKYDASLTEIDILEIF